MYKEKKILAVVPARGGSKGILKKNLREVHGIPLVGWAGKVISEINQIDRAVVSTDCGEIATVASSYGLDSPFLRPDFLSGDLIGDYEVLVHALKEMERLDGITYDILLMIQPTSPLRKADEVIKCFQMLVDESFDSVWTVSETGTKNHPLKQLKISSDNSLEHYAQEGEKIIARQQLSPIYHRNGVCYAISRNCLIEQKKMMGKKAGALILNDSHISIDTEDDLALVENILKNSNK